MRFIKGGGAGFIEGHLLPVTLRGIWEDGVEKMGEGAVAIQLLVRMNRRTDRPGEKPNKNQNKQTNNNKTTKKKEEKREEQKEKSYVGI